MERCSAWGAVVRGYTLRAWDLCSLQYILDVPLVFRSFATSSQRLKTLNPRI